MMKSEAVTGVQPAVIRWARESIGMSIEDVASRLKKPVDVVSSWEQEGGGAPTYIQLETLAYEVYKRPLAVFFLPEPPDEKRPSHEFRTLPAAELTTLWVDTHFHIRKAHAYQVSLKDLYSDTNPAPIKIWEQISLSLQKSPKVQAENVRELLGIGIEEQAHWDSDEEALRKWRQAIEDMGVFVFKDAFKQKSISGFCLQDSKFPVIYLNNSTAKTRQIFSLLHELSHLLFHMNGLSKFDQGYIDNLPVNERRIEVFCNAVAAEILIPSTDFDNQIRQLPENAEKAPEAIYGVLAKRYGVSREVILRRFLDLGRVEQKFYEAKAAEWTKQKKTKPGGDWYLSKGAYLSDRFLREVFSRHYRQELSVEQASDFLGIKAKNLAGLEQLVLKRSAA
ncbi:MAG: XRE family transcriptional regulator [Sulfuricella sp.]|nr:XRE family transcriptional regulator [Sulfuricella sp.]